MRFTASYITQQVPESIASFYPNTIIGGVSKSLSMTGWRLGWLGGDDDFIKSALILHGCSYHLRLTISQRPSSLVRGPQAGDCAPGGARHFP